jgi:Domain of unknown function (DUF4234)
MLPEQDPLTNPYAPPAASSTERGAEARPRGVSRYDDEQRSVLLLLVLSVVTLGIYPAFWYLRRQPFLDSLDASKKLGGLPIVLVATTFGLFFVSFFVEFTHASDGLSRIAQLADGIFNLFVAFRAAAILRSDFARTGRMLHISGAGVFFFGMLYLQHVLNEAAATPPRVPRSSST